MSTDRHEDATTVADREPSRAIPSTTTASSWFDRGLDTTGGLDFVRQRLLLLGKTVFLLSSIFFLLLVASLVVMGGAPVVDIVTRKVAIGHLLASSCMAMIWLLTRRPTASRTRLGAIDLFGCTLGGLFLGFMAFDDPFQVHQATAAVTVTVLTRAILVPSRPRRTLLISSLMFLPTIVVAIVRHHPTDFLPGFPPGYQKMHLVLNTVLWSALGVTLATVASRVTYGLRRQVAEVSELGQYSLEEKMRGGGMGEVWRGRHRLLIRPAAVRSEE